MSAIRPRSSDGTIGKFLLITNEPGISIRYPCHGVVKRSADINVGSGAANDVQISSR